MTSNDDLDQQLNAFLHEGPTDLPDRSFDAIRDRTERTRQRVVLGSWRLPDASTFLVAGLGTAAVVIVLLGSNLLGFRPVPGNEPSASPGATAEPSSVADLQEGPHLLWDDGGVAITVDIPAPDWRGLPSQGTLCHGSESCAEPPAGAGVISFVHHAYYVYGDACAWSSTRPDTPATTVDELVAALANQAGREASAPEDITLDGHSGKSIVLEMSRDAPDFASCDEGKFSLFGVPTEDAARYSQGPGQVEEVWIVDVDGQLAVNIGLYYPYTAPNVVDQVRAILGSATFE